METLWFCLVALMIAAYVVLDGLDLGAGAVHLVAARTNSERRHVLRSIGPVWDGNEVWLLAAGGTLYFAFPRLYASSFSGFYLPLMIVLWLLILRGISIEFRNHLEGAIWQPFWDVVFAASSLLLAVFFGAALGNVIRGVPLDPNGEFFMALWTDFRTGPNPAILDWYTVLVGLLALLALTLHGALWVSLKTDLELAKRSRMLAAATWWGVVALTVVVTAATFVIRPELWSNFRQHPWGIVFPALAVAGLILARRSNPSTAFLASCAYICGMLTSAAFSVYPTLLSASGGAGASLTISNSGTSAYSYGVGLAWWIPGMLLAVGYFVFTYRRFAGKVTPEEESH